MLNMILQFIHFVLYSVIKSDGNSFCGDVVFDSFNKTSRDENNVLDQIYKSKHVLVIIENSVSIPTGNVFNAPL